MPPEADPAATGSRQQDWMRSFVADLLRHEGALVEAVAPDGLEVLAPPEVQRVLGIAELSRFAFGAGAPPGFQRVGMEGDWLDRFGRLLGPRGRRVRRILAAPPRMPGDPERMLGHELVLDNATYRLLGVAPAWTRYLIFDFRASAVSDDKRDFVLRVAVNLATGSVPDAVVAAIAGAADAPADDAAPPADVELPATWDRARLAGLLARAVPARIDLALAPFVRGMRRRLERDQDRLHVYHNDLYRQAALRALALAPDDPRREREERRMAAIEREYRAKLDDLSRQYATRVAIEWIQTMELVMPVHRFAVQIRRRKADRTIRLDWNPVARRLEPPACESTASTEKPRLVCDGALHLVVPAALGPCPGCGRSYCRACHPDRCPKCGALEPRRRVEPRAG
ncbi:MAG: hydrogenase maturation nickel metallochaperone HypA [Alphaproteobacteria bacterium]|nr:hydrogenase maturation nickel metallochaperone HypA [Alphaproteobacteria bacterium]